MASRRNKARRNYRRTAPASIYDMALKQLGKPYVTMQDLRDQNKAFCRMARTFIL